ncbi:MAG: hypothetical protein K6E85_01215 [Lachnospiraceae bacterium]|nr:hypothetical protein [Lachnospiraceae bacterium]
MTKRSLSARNSGRRYTAIEISEQTIKEIILSVFAAVTDQLADIELTEASSVPDVIDNPLSVVVMSRGNFISKAVMTLPREFAQTIVDRMSNGSELSESDREAYFLEFVNIFFGRFISAVNNKTGHPSRFVIPQLQHGAYQDNAESSMYNNSVSVGMSGEYGNLRIVIKYDVLPDYSKLQGSA